MAQWRETERRAEKYLARRIAGSDGEATIETGAPYPEPRGDRRDGLDIGIT
jgi:hypothetical protein